MGGIGGEGGVEFTKLDLSQAYQQLLLSPNLRELLTISTPKGLFQPTRLQFGVHSMSAILQRKLENRLASIPYVKVQSDNIFISGKNIVEHFNNLRKVLKIIYNNGLHLKLQKCVLMQDEVVYLGFKMNKNRIFPLKEKIVAINAEEPKNVSELKSFLGLLNYYHRHSQGFADTLEPLHNLLGKGVKWEWQEQEKNAFEKAKKKTDETNFLIRYDPKEPLLLACDTSLYGLGTVLSHRMPDGSEKPITFASRPLSKAECNYSQIDITLAIVYTVKKFHQYLFGRHFLLYTNHKPLLGLKNKYIIIKKTIEVGQ